MKLQSNSNLLVEWFYSEQEWNEFVTLEKANKKEDNIYFGVGIIIIGTIGLMLLRNASFLIGITFSFPLAVLIPWLRMKFSYKHLKKDIKDPFVKIYTDYMLINNNKIEVSGSKKRIKSLKIIEAKNGMKLLEVDIQWATRKGPTNDEYRILIPSNKIKEAETLINNFYNT